MFRSYKARWPMRMRNGRFFARIFFFATVLLLSSFLPSAAHPQSSQLSSGTIQGTVRNGSGIPVSDASVFLTLDGAASLETRSTSDGSFRFTGLTAGTYVVSAEKAGRRSRKITLASAEQQARRVDLTLEEEASGVQNKKTSPTMAPAMEFADNPNFTIAAVTDWTAAGGHGSDAVLRTSEAINRETITLKPEGSANATVTSETHKTEDTLRAALDGAPGTFEANHNLGAFYLTQGRFADSLPLLQNAYKIDPTNFDNEYDLAQSLKSNGDFVQASDHVQKLMTRRENADLHRLAGEIDEKMKDPLSAVHEFERAVREDPSEQNYFEWGSELLLHRAVWQAKDVFSSGVTAYPKSGRMLTALGASLFGGALYDEAARRLCDASDLNPADPEPYKFMGKVELASPDPLPCVEQKLARFVEQRPGDPLANYYFAMAVWKQKGQAIDPQSLHLVEDLLTKAVTIDPKCGDAYLQLGVLQFTRYDYEKAIGLYGKAIEANPQLSEAHYRLGIAYDRVGDKDKARREFQLHDEIEKQQAAAVEKQRRDIKQFLVVDRKPDNR